VQAIRKAVFPGVDPSQHACMYRKLLSDLRGANMVPEHFVGGGRWAEVDYDRMASRCRLLYGRTVFAKNDKERYDAFLETARRQVEGGLEGEKAVSVNVGAIFPHEVTTKAYGAWNKLNGIDHNNSLTPISTDWMSSTYDREDAARDTRVQPPRKPPRPPRTNHAYRFDQHSSNHITPTTQHQPHSTTHQPHSTTHTASINTAPTTQHQPHSTNHTAPRIPPRSIQFQPHNTNHTAPTTQHHAYRLDQYSSNHIAPTTHTLQQETSLQWNGILDDCKKAAAKGESFTAFVPVCDVSGATPP
jgi:hypothetical protein